MKKILILIGLLLAGALAADAQNDAPGNCDCPSCAAKESGTFTIPGLEGLNEPEAHDHAEEAPVEEVTEKEEICCPHEAPGDKPVPHDHDGDGVSDHDKHADPDSHSGHDHGGQSGGGIELTQDMIQAAAIQVHEAIPGTVTRSRVFPAEIKLNRDRTAAVSPRYPSIVRKVSAEIGDAVHAGDVLASLENRETMAVYTVTAPQDGVIISKDLAVGETAGDDRVLFEVADLSTVWADISIFPQYQHTLRSGMSVIFIAHDGHSASGVIKYISPIVSHETRTFTARCVLEDAGEDFTPGAFVRARITVEKADADVVIPRQAVQTVESESVVFIPGRDGFVTVPVELGLADDHNVEIRSGLEPGDRYVAVGAFTLKAHMITGGMDPHAGHGH